MVAVLVDVSALVTVAVTLLCGSTTLSVTVWVPTRVIVVVEVRDFIVAVNDGRSTVEVLLPVIVVSEGRKRDRLT